MSTGNRAYPTPRGSAIIRKRRRRRQRIRRLKKFLAVLVGIFLIYKGVSIFGADIIEKVMGKIKGEDLRVERFIEKQENSNSQEYPQELLELLEKNPETYDFVTSYPDRSKYQGKVIDVSDEVKEGQVPLFLQWDRRWGYDGYGSEMIALAGCGPTCMSMAYTYLTGETDMNPREMAEFAEENNYNTEAGTSWNFFTDGAEQLGLKGAEIGLDEAKMKEVLDEGKVIICSMRPGDFTTTGHFILIRGYDAKGFLANDPNSEENSGKHWSYDRLQPQIKCLWSIE
ncbi:MAG: C39 family peptidase [Clostridiales bacterium]|nr:C39 family peptidase [Clostridiales bacterium]